MFTKITSKLIWYLKMQGYVVRENERLYDTRKRKAVRHNCTRIYWSLDLYYSSNTDSILLDCPKERRDVISFISL